MALGRRPPLAVGEQFFELGQEVAFARFGLLVQVGAGFGVRVEVEGRGRPLLAPAELRVAQPWPVSFQRFEGEDCVALLPVGVDGLGRLFL